MIKIQKLQRPTKASGFELKAGKATYVRGVRIVNQNTFSIYIDKWTRPKEKRVRRKK